MRFLPAWIAGLVLLWLNSAAAVSADDLGLRVPAGFEVQLYADDELAHDIFSMTVDSQGRVVVSGPGYVKTLHDTDGDGRADRATLYSDKPQSGAHGLLFDGPDLICTGDNSVLRLRDRDGDGTADGQPEVWTELRNPEHGANGLTRGPDGSVYLICGNDAGVGPRQATSLTSPVRQPRCGGVVRFSREGKPLEVFAHGFRNPYDLDFDAAGHLLTVDSDGERDHHLPWYAPTRLFDVAQGMEHGWLLKGWTQSWNRPQSFYDNVERMSEIGRGSPTGVVTYRHRQFPEHYRGGVFAACWTFGRVYYFPLSPSGATSATKLETFLETTGDVGFAPCDLAVGPEGDLFVAIGGRRTRGSVFRVRHTQPKGLASPVDALGQVLAADQPQASWSRADWVPRAERLGRDSFERAVVNSQLPPAWRVRAVEILVELFDGLELSLAGEAVVSKEPAVRARVAWALGRQKVISANQELLARLTSDEDPAVNRAAWEALSNTGTVDANLSTQPDWSRGLSSPERRVRQAAIHFARRDGRASYDLFRSRVRIASNAWPLRLAAVWIKLPEEGLTEEQATPFTLDDWNTCQDAFTAQQEPVARLECLRLIQLGLGDLRLHKNQAEVYGGYAGKAAAGIESSLRGSLTRRIAGAFPATDPELNRELARTLGMLESDSAGLPSALTGRWGSGTSVEDDIHYLIVLSLVPGPRSPEVTQATVDCLLALHAKLDAGEHYASRNWPLRVGEVFDELIRRDSRLGEVLAGSPRLSHLGHALYVERLPKPLQAAAIRQLWSATVGRGVEPSAELISLVGKLGDEALPLVRSQWEHPGLRDAIVLVLAKSPQPDDRARLIEGLASTQPVVVEKVARSLFALGMQASPDEMVAALLALKQACALEKQEEPRRILMRLLEFWTEDGADVDWDPDPAKYYVGWFKLFADYYPAEARRLNAAAGADADAWQKRLATLDWEAGNAERGRAVFERRMCHRCHQASGHLGPELKGAVSRMSRDDLFAAIYDPNREVSPTYWTTLVATQAGQVYHGLVVYESPEGTLLQTGPDTTVRITGAETSSLHKSAKSLMPTGLLDVLDDRDLSDLYAYMKSLAR